MKAHGVACASAMAIAVLGTPVAAQELRTFCPDRPGLGTPPCTIDEGHVVVEVGGADWTREDDGMFRIDTVVAGDALVRYGLTGTLEMQVGWTAFGSVHVREKASGASMRIDGTGDVAVAIRKNIANPDGSAFSVAAMGYVTVPTGGAAIGAGDWSGGVLIPLSYALSDTVSLGLTPQVSAEVDGDRDGRHLAYGSVVGLGIALDETLSTAIEVQATRDRDPDAHSTQLLGSLSLGWQPQDGMQLDVGAVAGLNASSPDVQLYLGIARRF